MNVVLQGQVVAAVAIMVLFAIVRRWAEGLDLHRRAVLDNVRLLWLYAVAQSLPNSYSKVDDGTTERRSRPFVRLAI